MAALPAPARRRPARIPAARPHERPTLRVVERPRRARRYVVAALVVGALGVFGAVSLSALAAEQAFAGRALEAEIDELTMRYEELVAEVAALEAPERVRHVAETELGMTTPEAPSFLMASRSVAPPAVVATGDVRSDAPEPVADPLKQALASGR